LSRFGASRGGFRTSGNRPNLPLRHAGAGFPRQCRKFNLLQAAYPIDSKGFS
jgi:hypothetical protein